MTAAFDPLLGGSLKLVGGSRLHATHWDGTVNSYTAHLMSRATRKDEPFTVLGRRARLITEEWCDLTPDTVYVTGEFVMDRGPAVARFRRLHIVRRAVLKMVQQP